MAYYSPKFFTQKAMHAIIEVKNLVKTFKTTKAVDGVSFAIPRGKCFGILGPNGAGKTTTIEIIEGIKKPTSGEIYFKGEPRNDHFYQQTGIQFQSTSLMDFLTTREVLELFSSFYAKTMSVDQLIELCHLQDFLETYATHLSGGQRQRLLLAVALVNDPEIIFLDEPTTGLDPQARRNFWTLIENVRARGKTIVLTTHYMDEAELLCDELVIMDKGHIIAQGTPAGLLSEHFGYFFVSLDADNCDIEKANLKEPIHRQNGQWIIETRSVEQTLNHLIGQDIALNSLSIRNPSLDDLFLKITGSHLRD